MDILSIMQFELVANKGQRNNFGNYNYRSCEDILQGLKPLIDKYQVSVILSDDIKIIGDRIYVVATARLIKNFLEDSKGGFNTIVLGEATAFAREPKDQKGMNEAQITGTASSYARKYALNGLFAIDDAKDADTDEHHNNSNNRPDPKKNAVEKVQPVINWSNKIRDILKQVPVEKLDDYRKLLNDGIMPKNKTTYDKICKDNNINA